MRAVTFQAPGEVRVDEVADPELTAPDEAIVRVEASGVCGSDLHIYHGRVAIEAGLHPRPRVRRHGDRRRRRGRPRVSEGDRVLGTYGTACGECFFCRRGDFHKCDHGRVFGHGKTLGSLQGAQAELLLVPNADLTLRRVPEGMSDDVALFAGDVMGTGYHAVVECGVGDGDGGRGARPRPGRPLRRAGGARRRAPPAWSRSTRSPSGSSWPARSAPSRST